MARYRTKEGDMLDMVCLTYYGQAVRYVEAVLETNPGLAEIGAVLPAGIMIELPDFPEIKERAGSIRLWS